MDEVSLKVGTAMPRSIGFCADEYHEVRAFRLAMQKEVDAVKARETELQEYIIENLSKSDDTGAAGKYYRAQIIPSVVPVAEDWEDIYDYIVENDRFDLLNRSLNQKATKELWEAGVKIPGIGRFNSKKVSITKL